MNDNLENLHASSIPKETIKEACKTRFPSPIIPKENVLSNEEKITLERKPWTIDSMVEVAGGETIRPFGYHEDPAKRLQIQWKVAD